MRVAVVWLTRDLRVHDHPALAAACRFAERVAARLDSDGGYIRRYVPELAHLPTPFLHEPWRLAGTVEAPDYPEPIVDHAEAVARFRQRVGVAWSMQ